MHGHFRSRDKDGSHSIRSTIVKKPMLHANFTALCYIITITITQYIEPELLPIKVLHCGNRAFQPFLFLWPCWWPS